jgi:hypothetical protein
MGFLIAILLMETGSMQQAFANRRSKEDLFQDRNIPICLIAFDNDFWICHPEIFLNSSLKLFSFPGTQVCFF